MPFLPSATIGPIYAERQRWMRKEQVRNSPLAFSAYIHGFTAFTRKKGKCATTLLKRDKEQRMVIGIVVDNVIVVDHLANIDHPVWYQP